MSAPDITTASQLDRLAGAPDTLLGVGVQTNDREAPDHALRAALNHATNRSAGGFRRRGVLAATGAVVLAASAVAQGRRVT